MAVHLTGTENLPPFIKSMLDSSYNYHSHELKCEPSEDGFDYKYSLTVSKVPLNGSSPSENSETTAETTTVTTTSEDTATTTTQSVQYRVKPMQCSKNIKCIMMVQIKFILLHLDPFGNRVQSMFIEEVSTEANLKDVIIGFREACLDKMPKGKAFNPRMSYCVGEVTRQNSKPIMPEDLEKTINELVGAVKNPIGKMVFVADTLNYF